MNNSEQNSRQYICLWVLNAQLLHLLILWISFYFIFNVIFSTSDCYVRLTCICFNYLALIYFISVLVLAILIQ